MESAPATRTHQVDGLIAGIQSGKCDYALSGITPRGTRALAVSFAKPTLAAAELVVVPKSQSKTTMAALNSPSVRFCGQSGTGSEFDAKKYFPKTKITLVPTASDCLLQLLSRPRGRLAQFLCGTGTCPVLYT